MHSLVGSSHRPEGGSGAEWMDRYLGLEVETAEAGEDGVANYAVVLLTWSAVVMAMVASLFTLAVTAGFRVDVA